MKLCNRPFAVIVQEGHGRARPLAAVRTCVVLQTLFYPGTSVPGPLVRLGFHFTSLFFVLERCSQTSLAIHGLPGPCGKESVSDQASCQLRSSCWRRLRRLRAVNSRTKNRLGIGSRFKTRKGHARWHEQICVIKGAPTKGKAQDTENNRQKT